MSRPPPSGELAPTPRRFPLSEVYEATKLIRASVHALEKSRSRVAIRVDLRRAEAALYRASRMLLATPSPFDTAHGGGGFVAPDGEPLIDGGSITEGGGK